MTTAPSAPSSASLHSDARASSARQHGSLPHRWREQLWAEAVVAFKAGKQWHLTTAEEYELASIHQDYQREDAWLGSIEDYLRGRSEVTVEEILTNVLHLPLDRHGRPEQMRVSGCLKRLHWVKSDRRRVIAGKKRHLYQRGPKAPVEEPAPSAAPGATVDQKTSTTSTTAPERQSSMDTGPSANTSAGPETTSATGRVDSTSNWRDVSDEEFFAQFRHSQNDDDDVPRCDWVDH